MANVFGIDVSALQAFQQAIEVTSNNVANASTPGYDEESIELGEAPPQSSLGFELGSGVDVLGVSRAFSQSAANQLNSSQSSLGQLNVLQNYTSQIDNLFGDTASGLTTALQNYYNGWSAVADDPTSAGARESLLGDANALADNLSTTSGQLQGLNSDINASITADVQQINSISSSIASLNQQIVGVEGNGASPNSLLDQRDQLLSNLSQLVGVTTTTDSNGALNVFTGQGVPLVIGSTSNTLTTIPDRFNPSQLEISSSDSDGSSISSSITSGNLGGLLAARTQAIEPALNQLGQIATAVAQSANLQQNSGLDLNGELGANLFSLGAPLATASTANTDNTQASVSISNLGELTADNYLLSYTGGTYTLTDTTTGASVALTGAGTAANPLQAAGLSIVLSQTPASGDEFLIQPTAQAAGSIKVALSDPSALAAAGAIQTSAADTNAGTATIDAGTVLDPTNPNLLATTTIEFLSPTTYSVNGAGSFAYTSGGNIDLNGWQVQISGTPATGDVFTVQSNAGATGDNTNALANVNQQSEGVLSNGTTSVSGAVSSMITNVGAQAQQVTTAQTAQAAVNTQAQTNVQSVSGVNLDQEAANLLQWQQAYQASAQALSVANGLFTDFLDSINGTYS
ncbi:MAG TPA: flagellar hook-associated protein FlgK [Steroidobacteraceae bacterium]|nr:flagellar hook-associated protein FlgK [Steroidobacteraceae bacterium]